MANIKEINIRLQTAKRLMSNLIIKQTKRAYDNETKESASNYYIYYNAYMKMDKVSDYENWTEAEIRHAFPSIVDEDVKALMEPGIIKKLYLENEFSDLEIERLMDAKRASIISYYVELNEYYRMLIGLPSLEDMKNNNFIYYNGTAIHELPYTVKLRLRRDGTFDNLFSDNNKQYIRFIGREIDLITAREAEEFEVLSNYKDKSEYEIYAICYNKEREMWMRSFYNEWLMYETDFYEAEDLLILKLHALIAYVLESKKPFIHKSTYSQQEAINIWRSNGLVLPKNMPELYRNSCTFVLNYLLMFKGTNYVMNYITEKLFSGLNLYKYFIRKVPKENLTYPLTGNETPEELYDVQFILRPFRWLYLYQEEVSNSTEDKILSYDEVVRMDPRWRDTEELKRAVFSEEFSFAESKYLSLGNSINITKFGQWYAILHRWIMENRKIAEKQQIRLKSTNQTHNFFAVFMYYMSLTTFQAHRYHIFETDTIPDIDKLYGVHIPDNFDEIKIRWISEFNATEYKFALDNFPNALNNNATFIEMIVAMEKAMGTHDLFDKLKLKVRNLREYLFMNEIERLIRHVERVPQNFGQTKGSEVPTTYQDILKDIDNLLYAEYERIKAPFDIASPTDEDLAKRENLTIEIDNLTQELITFFNELPRDTYPNSMKVQDVLDTTQRFMNGLSKYLLYILKTFKAYTVDFISEGGILKMGPDMEYQLNFDNIWTHVRYNLSERMNIGSNDRITIKYKKPVALTLQSSHDYIKLNTLYGDVEVYDGEGGNL